nr:YlxR family protein [Romeria gracilis]
MSCRRIDHRQNFWRIVRVHPSRQVQLDQGMGRSAYLCPRADCLTAAKRKNRLARVLKAQVPETLYQTLEQRLEQSEEASAGATSGSANGVSAGAAAPQP